MIIKTECLNAFAMLQNLYLALREVEVTHIMCYGILSIAAQGNEAEKLIR